MPDGLYLSADGPTRSLRSVTAADGPAERARLVEKESVLREARAEAERLLTAAREQADAMRDEVEDYVDGKLANFEVVLAKTLAAVEKGRARLSGSSELDDLRG